MLEKTKIENKAGLSVKKEIVTESKIAGHHIQTVLEGMQQDGYLLMILFCDNETGLYKGIFKLKEPKIDCVVGAMETK